MKVAARRGECRTCTGSVVVVQDALGRIVQIIELPIPGRTQEQPYEQPGERHGDRQQEKKRLHQSPPRIIRSTRAAFQITTLLDSGMSTAATSGLIRPATAAATASAL